MNEDGSLDRHQLIKQIFTTARELNGQERSNYLQSATAGDPDLLVDVQALLAEAEKSQDFLATPLPEQLPVPAAEDPRRGLRIGPYKIRSLVAHGGYSSIYEAVRDDGMFSRRVALKFASRGIGSGLPKQRLLREIQLLSNLEHRCICRLLDAGCHGQDVYAVLEYAQGGTLLNYAASHSLTIIQRLQLFTHLCEAVQAVHGNGYFHCDLKPANVLVRRDGSICLIDFGSARRIGEPETDDAPLDRIPIPMTIAYASPEMLSGGEVSNASEVYSLGMILYELITGDYPYRPGGKLRDQLVSAILYDDPTPFPDAADKDGFGNYGGSRPTASMPLDLLRDIAMYALQKSPGDRYSSVATLTDDVRAVLRGVRPLANVYMDEKRSESSRLDKPLRIFMAYSREDRLRVLELHQKLIIIGAQPWLDEIDLLPGSVWKTALEEALRDSDVVLVCLTPAYSAKIGFAQVELKLVLQRAAEHPDDSIFVIPVRLEDCDIPEPLKQRQWVNLYEPNGLPRLLNALRAKCKQIGS